MAWIPDYVHPAWCASDGSLGGPHGGVGIGEQVRPQQRTTPVLLTPSVRGHAPRLVHGQRRGREQHQEAARCVDHELNPRAEIGTGKCRLCR